MKRWIIGITCAVIAVIMITSVVVLTGNINKERGGYKLSGDGRLYDIRGVRLTDEEKEKIKAILTLNYRHNDDQAGFISGPIYYTSDAYTDSRVYSIAKMLDDEYSVSKFKSYYGFIGTKGHAFSMPQCAAASLICFFKDIDENFIESEYVDWVDKNIENINMMCVAALTEYFDRDEIMKKRDVRSYIDGILKKPYDNNAADVMSAIDFAHDFGILDMYDKKMLKSWFDEYGVSEFDKEYAGRVDYYLTGDNSIYADYIDGISDNEIGIDEISMQMAYYKLRNMRNMGCENKVYEENVRKSLHEYVDSMKCKMIFIESVVFSGVCLAEITDFDYDRDKIKKECMEYLSDHIYDDLLGCYDYVLLSDILGVSDEIPEAVKKHICDSAAKLDCSYGLNHIAKVLIMNQIIGGKCEISKKNYEYIIAEFDELAKKTDYVSIDQMMLMQMVGYKRADEILSAQSHDFSKLKELDETGFYALDEAYLLCVVMKYDQT